MLSAAVIVSFILRTSGSHPKHPSTSVAAVHRNCPAAGTLGLERQAEVCYTHPAAADLGSRHLERRTDLETDRTVLIEDRRIDLVAGLDRTGLAEARRTAQKADHRSLLAVVGEAAYQRLEPCSPSRLWCRSSDR